MFEALKRNYAARIKDKWEGQTLELIVTGNTAFWDGHTVESDVVARDGSIPTSFDLGTEVVPEGEDGTKLRIFMSMTAEKTALLSVGTYTGVVRIRSEYAAPFAFVEWTMELYGTKGPSSLPPFDGSPVVIHLVTAQSTIVQAQVVMSQGTPGMRGEKGDQGDKGDKGDAGDPGGPPGPTGPQGAVGPQGPVGPTGPAGATGPAGPAGPAGPQGSKGDKGDTGATGPQGPVGPQGSVGPQGANGAAGATGSTGPVGPPGPTGSTGPQGPKGDQGDPGPSAFVYSTNTYGAFYLSAASGAATNIGVNLAPKGTGGFHLGPLPDGASTGGNARGQKSVDLQLGRSSPTAVASGFAAFAAGYNCTGSGDYSFTGGINCTANGVGTVALGFGSVVNTNYSFAAGASCAIVGGDGSICLGYVNLVNVQGWILGGFCVNDAYFGTVLGWGARNYLHSSVVEANGYFAAVGDSQTTRETARAITNDSLGQSITMFIGNPYWLLDFPAGKTLDVELTLIARCEGNQATARWKRSFLMWSTGTASLEIIGAIDTIGTDKFSAAWVATPPTFAISADTSAGGGQTNYQNKLRIQVNGISGKEIRWAGHLVIREMSF